MYKFKVGDVVRLKSGSPKLTVTDVMNDPLITVTWIVYETSETRTLTAFADCFVPFTNNQ